jgi:hypothetical protein
VNDRSLAYGDLVRGYKDSLKIKQPIASSLNIINFKGTFSKTHTLILTWYGN